MVALSSTPENWISNGHFAVKKTLVKFGDKITSDDAAAVAFPKCQTIVKKTDDEMLEMITPPKRPHLYTRSFWASEEAAMFVDEQGNVIWLARDYADAFELGLVYAIDGKSAAYNAAEAEAITIVVMPVSNAPAWNEIAKCVAKATPLFDGEKKPSRAPKKATDTAAQPDVH
jgi:hypothetical protein